MTYLLDTHILIWYLEDSPKLPETLIGIIDDPVMDICISATSLWEITIKVGLGKLTLKMSLDELFNYVNTSDFRIIQIESGHLLALSQLPYIHKDPFDRLLIAVGKAEQITIITDDDNIQKYDAEWKW